MAKDRERGSSAACGIDAGYRERIHAIDGVNRGIRHTLYIMRICGARPLVVHRTGFHSFIQAIERWNLNRREKAAMDLPPCCTATGAVTNPCARTVYEQRVSGLVRLAGAWKGWRIQDGALIGPGGVRWTPQTLTHAHRWQSGLLRGG